jgi:hypothetical protein
MMRKGQGAMEYLMTYGWALLVIIIVGAALFALGVLNPATYQQKTCSGFQYFTYVDHKLNTSALVLNLRNANQRINVTSIKIGAALEIDPYYPNGTLSIAEPMAQAANFIIRTLNVPVVTAGAVYSDVNITVRYDVIDGIVGNTESFTCTGTVASA